MCGLVRRQPAFQLTGLRHTRVLDAGICYVHDGDVGGCRPRNPQEEKQQYPRRPDATRSTFESYGTSDGRRCAIQNTSPNGRT